MVFPRKFPCFPLTPFTWGFPGRFTCVPSPTLSHWVLPIQDLSHAFPTLRTRGFPMGFCRRVGRRNFPSSVLVFYKTRRSVADSHPLHFAFPSLRRESPPRNLATEIPTKIPTGLPMANYTSKYFSKYSLLFIFRSITLLPNTKSFLKTRRRRIKSSRPSRRLFSTEPQDCRLDPSGASF